MTRDVKRETFRSILTRGALTFLGVSQVRALWAAWRSVDYCPQPRLGTPRLLLVALIAVLPVLGYFLGEQLPRLDVVSLFVGVATVVSLVLRRSMGIPFESVRRWGESMRLTHIACALGCIPVVVMMVCAPEILMTFAGQRGDVVGDAVQSTRAVWAMPTFIAFVALWAGVTEEVIYRGLVLATIRRWTVLANSPYRDLVAVVVSAALFAIVHVPVWGLPMSVAVFGLGLGFGTAFVVTGERLLPVVVYHVLFDAAALTLAALWR